MVFAVFFLFGFLLLFFQSCVVALHSFLTTGLLYFI